ncbi:MAG: hypothetical protein JNM68_11335 [Dinghuibacter sp.]|nr:hypothetical protein [Dinghuibacter sp.]
MKKMFSMAAIAIALIGALTLGGSSNANASDQNEAAEPVLHCDGDVTKACTVFLGQPVYGAATIRNEQ